MWRKLTWRSWAILFTLLAKVVIVWYCIEIAAAEVEYWCSRIIRKVRCPKTP